MITAWHFVADTLRDGSPIPCKCGCGLPAPVYQRTNARKGHVKGAPAPFISGHNRRGTVDLTRFIRDPGGCWLWTGSKDRKGYGRVQVAGVHTNAHREVFKAHGGVIPDGMQLDHLCRNPGCVNPEHMEPVTILENVRRQHASRNSLVRDCFSDYLGA